MFSKWFVSLRARLRFILIFNIWEINKKRFYCGRERLFLAQAVTHRKNLNSLFRNQKLSRSNGKCCKFNESTSWVGELQLMAKTNSNFSVSFQVGTATVNRVWTESIQPQTFPHTAWSLTIYGHYQRNWISWAAESFFSKS
jgi:hypothetical protein